MRIIPVLDLKGGVVVRAAGGHRDRYRPIGTPLASGPAPEAVAEGLRGLAPFASFYVADLDAIAGGGFAPGRLAALRALSPPAEIWLDAGFATPAALDAALAASDLLPVLGSELQRDQRLLEDFAAHPRLILSLDFFADGYRGPPAILAEPGLWPDRVIVMSLAKVGSAGGPDFSRLAAIKRLAGARTVIAAGGVRDRADLAHLGDIGIDTALVASALHAGTLTSADLDLAG